MMRMFLLWAQARAEEGSAALAEHAEGPVHVPWETIRGQTFNLLLLVGLLIYLLRHTVKAHFENRAREYQQLVARAEAARSEAERGKLEIEKRLQALHVGTEESMARARSEGEELKQRMAKEAQVLAQKMGQEAERTAAVELEKAKGELRHELLQLALKASGENFGKNLSTSEQQKLQNEFAEKIQGAGG